MLRQRALAAYKESFKATRIAFGGDNELLVAARNEIKKGFKSASDKTEQERVEHIEGINKFLMRNLVQGKKQESGEYKLNIHQHTELGDNESIKKAKKTLAAMNGGCCGGGAGLVN